MDEKSRAFIFGERLKDAPEIPQMTKEQMEECINKTEEYIPKIVKNEHYYVHEGSERKWMK